jgi:hypothetical protein
VGGGWAYHQSRGKSSVLLPTERRPRKGGKEKGGTGVRRKKNEEGGQRSREGRKREGRRRREGIPPE